MSGPALHLRLPAGYEAERRYAAEVVLTEFLGLEFTAEPEDRDRIAIALADGGDAKDVTVADVLFRTPPPEWLTHTALPRLPLDRLDAATVPFPFRCVRKSVPVLYGTAAVTRSEAGVHIGVDIFGSAFFLLTRWEELVLPDRDEHDRFPAVASVAQRGGYLDRPLVNEYVELLWSALSGMWPRLRRRERHFTVVPSHDVDFPSSDPVGRRRELALRELRRERAPSVAARRLLGARGLYDTFDWIMRESEQRSLRSTFNFIPANTAGAIDGAYTLDDAQIQKLLGEISNRGHEIGFHPGYETFADAAQTDDGFRRLREACAQLGIEQGEWGGRQHYLRWRNPETWQNWEDAGLDYDSTLAFADRAGFRCGTCYEYPVFNLVAKRRLRLVERPLIVMDATLLEYEGLAFGSALATIEALKAACRRFDGQFTLLWHNDRLLSHRARRTYRQAIS